MFSYLQNISMNLNEMQMQRVLNKAYSVKLEKIKYNLEEIEIDSAVTVQSQM